MNTNNNSTGNYQRVDSNPTANPGASEPPLSAEQLRFQSLLSDTDSEAFAPTDPDSQSTSTGDLDPTSGRRRYIDNFTPADTPVNISDQNTGPITINEVVNRSGERVIEVRDATNQLLGEYDPYSEIEFNISATDTEIQVDPDANLRMNVNLLGLNSSVDIEAGYTEINVVGNDSSNNIRVNTDGNVFVDSAGGDDTIDIDDAQRLTIISSGGDNDIDFRNIRSADVRLTGDGNNQIDASNVMGTLNIDTENGNQSIDIARVNDVAIQTGDGNDDISAINVRGDISVDTGNATNYFVLGPMLQPKLVQGNDQVDISAQGDVMVTTGDGWDSVNATSGAGEIFLSTNAGVDNIVANANNNVTIDSGTFNDTILVENATIATVSAQGGHDRIDTYGADVSNIDGGDHDDFIRTGNGADTIVGGTGDDTVYSGAGDDNVSGQQGSDYIDAGHGNDTLSGDEGNDILSGNHGDDVINGGDDDDVLIAGTGQDTLSGGNGNGDLAYAKVGDLFSGRVSGVESTEFSTIPADFDPDSDLDRISVDANASDNFRDLVHDDLTTLRAIPTGAEGLALIENAVGSTGMRHNITIEELPQDDNDAYAKADNVNDAFLTIDASGKFLPGVGTGSTIQYNPSVYADMVTNYDPVTGEYNRDGRISMPVTVLVHELAHSYDFMTGQFDGTIYSGPEGRDTGTQIVNPENTPAGPGNTRTGDQIGNAERDAVGLQVVRPDGSTNSIHPWVLTENAIRVALNLDPRLTYI